MSGAGEAYMPPALVRRVLESASPDVVLIGGQALAYWMGYYDVHTPGRAPPAVTRGVDFFTRDAGNIAPLRAFAQAIGGHAQVRAIRALPARIGSAVAAADEGCIHNVDLLHRVAGVERASLDANAVTVALPGTGTTLRVMHPLDVLQSRNASLPQLASKQDAAGQDPFRLAIEVARRYLEERIDGIEQAPALAEGARNREILDVIRDVVAYSAEDAARKNAQRYGIFLADAIPAWRIRSAAFWERQWPHLRERMSPEHAQACEQRAGRGG